MTAGSHNPLRMLERRAWWLWGLTIALMLALTIALPAFFLPLMDAIESGGGWLSDTYNALVGVAGLVLVFCLYVISKQQELNRVRDRLLAEERELADVRTRLSELTALFHVSATINLQLNLGGILEIIVRRVVSALKAQQASIMLHDQQSGVLETRASYGLESELARNARKRVGEGIAGWVAEHQQALLLGTQPPYAELSCHYKAERNITSALSLPLRVGDRCVGVLNVNRINHPEPFREHHREILRLFAEHVGAVIDRAMVMDRLGAQASELQAANLKLAEMNIMKDAFLSTASHELKTPLTSVIAYAEMLDENAGQLAPTQQRDFLKRLRSEAQRLLGLIDDILDLSRLETGKLQLKRQPVSLNDVVREALETSSPLAQKHGVLLQHDLEEDLETLVLDPVKMRQVAINLLANAVNFSPTSATVRVRTFREGGCARLEVVDQGPGISAEDSTQIFKLFAQGNRPAAGRTSGTGIGLHLVKRLVELHGGEVGVTSTPGAGSTFWVRLPLTSTPAAEIPAAA
jgi:signal transduction histidine kinase